jgi:C-terminal processing protease CtpA/Prc
VVQPDGPAGKVGILVGDVIVAVDGMSVTGLNGSGVINVLDNRTPGSDVAVTVLRGSARTTFNIITAPRQYQ